MSRGDTASRAERRGWRAVPPAASSPQPGRRCPRKLDGWSAITARRCPTVSQEVTSAIAPLSACERLSFHSILSSCSAWWLSVFFVTHLLGDPARLMLRPEATEEQVAGAARALGLNDPMLVQFGRFMGDLRAGRLRRFDLAARAGHADRARPAAGHALSGRGDARRGDPAGDGARDHLGDPAALAGRPDRDGRLAWRASRPPISGSG